jgi:hypothetical protein
MSLRPTVDPLPHLHAVAMADATDTHAFFAAMRDALDAVFGYRLLTGLRYHPDSGDTERFYTSDPGAYPVGGRKHPTSGFWMQRLFVERKPYIGYSADDIREFFADHELILSLGCESILNLPVRHGGSVIGTINLLHEAGWYGEDDVPTGEIFAALAAPAILAMP